MIAQSIEKKVAVVALTVLVITGASVALITTKPSLANVKTLNLFRLVGNMNHTTAKMLHNTHSLHQEVTQVSQQLSQLQQQEQIIGQQVETGKQLQSSLDTQVNKTQTDVTLMKHILNTEKITAKGTGTIASASRALTAEVSANNQQLSQLQGSLHQSVAHSSALNQQMDTLLHELSSSEQEFKLFGQIHQLLPGLLSGSGSGGTNSSPVNQASGTVNNAITSTHSTVNQLLP